MTKKIGIVPPTKEVHSVCENPLCKQPAMNRCSACSISHYCGKACSKKMWPFHRPICQLKDTTLLLSAPFQAIPKVENFQLQMWMLLDALDRYERITPPDKDVPADPDNPTKPLTLKTSMRQLASVKMLDDAECMAQRMLFMEIVDADSPPIHGLDILPQLVNRGFTQGLALRLTMMGNSLKFCLSIMLAIEFIMARNLYLLIHGREKLGEYYMASGHTLTTQPRLAPRTTDNQDSATTRQLCQAAASTNSDYIILFMPTHVIEEYMVVNFSLANEQDKASLALDSMLTAERQKWESEFPNRLNPVPAEPLAAPAPRHADPFAEQFKDRFIFMAPAAGEHDARFHATRLRKGIPDWFVVDKVFHGSDIANMRLSTPVSEKIHECARGLVREMFGAVDATELEKTYNDSGAKTAAGVTPVTTPPAAAPVEPSSAPPFQN
jgi:hypothetical protein